MVDLLKKVKANALVSAALYAALGIVLLIWPALSTNVLCTALGAVLVLCGIVDIFVFLSNRDGSLYAGFHLVLGIVLSAVGVWLMARPTLVAVIIPRIIGILIVIHGVSDLGDAVTLRRNGYARWTTALLLGLVTLALGAILIFSPFQTFTTVVRLIGLFLLYDGVSDFWISTRVSRAVKQAAQDAKSKQDAVDVDFRDSEES